MRPIVVTVTKPLPFSTPVYQDRLICKYEDPGDRPFWQWLTQVPLKEKAIQIAFRFLKSKKVIRRQRECIDELVSYKEIVIQPEEVIDSIVDVANQYYRSGIKFNVILVGRELERPIYMEFGDLLGAGRISDQLGQIVGSRIIFTPQIEGILPLYIEGLGE